MTFGRHALLQTDGTMLTTEQRLKLALEEPTSAQALTQGQARAVTQNRIRSAMSELAHGNINNVQRWLQQVAEGVVTEEGKVLSRPDPAKAVELFMALAEYTLPKLKAVSVDVRSTDGTVKNLSIKDLESIVSEQ